MEPAQVCEEMSGELEDAARWLVAGGLSPRQFCSLLMALEAKKHERFGLKLSIAVSLDGVVHLSLRFAESGELCASMDVDPVSGKAVTQMAYS